MADNQQSRQLGSGFTNLQQLMAANQGNKLGQAVGSGIQQTGQQVKSGLQSGVNQFQTEAQKGQLGTQSDKENVQNVLKDPSQVSDTDVSNFAKYRAGQYTGPQDLANIQSLKGQASQAQQQGQALGSEGGRQTLLQRYAAGPGQYSQGSQKLDTLLLGSGSAKPLQEARRAVSGLSGQVDSAQQAAQQQAQQYGQQAQGFGKQVTGQVTGGINSIYGQSQSDAEKANVAEKQRQNEESNLMSNLTQGKLSKDMLQGLGLNSGDYTYGADLSKDVAFQKAIGGGATGDQATALNIMGQPQFNKYSGLQRLMGQTAPTQQTQYQAGKTTYNKDDAAAAMAQGKDAYDAYMANTVNPLQSNLAANLQKAWYWQQQKNKGQWGETLFGPQDRWVLNTPLNGLSTSQVYDKLAGHYYNELSDAQKQAQAMRGQQLTSDEEQT